MLSMTFYAADFNVSIENDKTVYTEVADSRIQPDWFNADKRSVWFSVDQADASGTSWRFTVKRKTGHELYVKRNRMGPRIC